MRRLRLCSSAELGDSPGEPEASWSSPDRLTSRLWPASTPGSLEVLPAVHQAIYKAVPSATAVFAVRTVSTEAVARSSEGGVRVVSQDGALFAGTIALCDDVGSMAAALEAMPTVLALMIRGHGMYTFGPTIAAAMVTAFYLDVTCKLQLLVGSRAVNEPDAKVVADTRTQLLESEAFGIGVPEWPAISAWLQGVELPLKAGQRRGEEGSEEHALRKELSLAHKEVADRKEDQMIWNHISAKCGEGILITPGDRMWELMEPEALVSNSENVTANILHSAVYSSTSLSAVVHLHTPAVQAVVSLKEGFVPPQGSEFEGRVAYHDWEGISDDADECPRIIATVTAVPGCKTLLMRNHGAITFGSSVRDALDRYWSLDRECREQLSARNPGVGGT